MYVAIQKKNTKTKQTNVTVENELLQILVGGYILFHIA